MFYCLPSLPRGTPSSPFTPSITRAGLPPHMLTRGGGRSAPLPRATDGRSMLRPYYGKRMPFPITSFLTTLTSLTSLTTSSTFNFQLKRKGRRPTTDDKIEKKN
jgi:hypothetical protein